MAAVTAGIELWYDIHAVLDPLSKGDWPRSLEFVEDELTKPADLPSDVIKNTGRTHLLPSIALFALFYDEMEQDANKRQQEPLVRFARSVRNFAAHGAVVRGIHPDAAPLEWRGLTWTSQDNGSPVLAGDVHGTAGLSRGDLVYLMADLYSLLAD